MAGNGSRPGELIAGINVTPLVDITLVLLIIFMVTAKIITTPAVPLDLPPARTSEQMQVVFSVLLPQKGVTLVDGQAVSDDSVLLKRAQEALARDKNVRAVISADGSVPHRRILATLDLLRRAGIAHIAFGARPLDEESPP